MVGTSGPRLGWLLGFDIINAIEKCLIYNLNEEYFALG